MKHINTKFKIDWVLVDELAIGPAPRKNSHLDKLKEIGIKSILTLCSEEEVKMAENFNQDFNSIRCILPDHRVGRLPEIDELLNALKHLEDLKKSGATYVHCVAAMERSPMVCMGWLVLKHNLSPQESLDYLMQVHKGTNPLPGQLHLLNLLNEK